MNTNSPDSPLVPQGSLPPKGKSTIKIAFFTIVAIHVVVIGGMLMQGCSKDKQSAQKTEDQNPPSLAGTQPPADPSLPAAALVDTAAVAAAPANPLAAPTQPLTPAPAVAVAPTPATTPAPAPTPTAAALPAPAAAPTEGTKEYVVARGDTLGGIAKKNHISLKALQDANPGVDPKKLQIDQKLQIPAGVATTASATPASATPAAADAGDSSSYTVKAGDVLERIAKTHGTSVKAIVALNNLKSRNSLKVGQKLKMPAAKAAAAPAAATSPAADATPVAPTTVAAAPAATSNQ